MNKKLSKLFVLFMAVIMMLSVAAISASAATPKLNKTSVTVVVGKTYTLKVSGYSGTVKWATSNKNVATVSTKGVVKGITTGSATITATAGSKKLTCKVTSKGFNIPSGATKYNGHYYKLYTSQKSWKSAKAACEALGGHLATITSSSEETIIEDILDANDVDRAWLGATDEKKEGTWSWITGEKWSYTNWAWGEPANKCTEHNGVENYLEIFRYDEWNDWCGSVKSNYICEWDGTTSKTGISKTSANVYYGSTTTLSVKYTAASVTWKSADTSIATVSSKGVVTGKKLGTTTISATTAGKTYKCTVKVIDRNVTASASLKCTSGGTFIKGVNTATATFKLKTYNAAKVIATVVDATGAKVYSKTFTNVKKDTATSFTWDGKKSDGSYVSAGSYRLKVVVGSKTSYSGYLKFIAKNDFAAGDGSKSNPFQVKTVSQFKKIPKYPTAYYKQISNIDFGYTATGGFFSQAQQFNGVYDGGSKYLMNITTSVPLFNYLGSKGVIKNLNMKSCVVTTSEFESAVLVRYNYGTINNCKINANMASTNGGRDSDCGIVCCNNYGKISNCNVTGGISITADHPSVGVIADYNSPEGKIISCTTNCVVKADDTCCSDATAGGIVDDNEGVIVSCEAQGTVSTEGLMGAIADSNSGSIQNTVYTGTQQINFVRTNTGVIA